MYDILEKFSLPTTEFQNDIAEITQDLKAVYNKQIIDSFIEQYGNSAISKTGIFNAFMSLLNGLDELTAIPSHIISQFRKSLKEQNPSLGLGAITSSIIHLQTSLGLAIQWDVEYDDGMCIYFNNKYVERIIKVVSVDGKIVISDDQTQLEIQHSANNVIDQRKSDTGIILLTNYSSDLLFEGNKRLNQNNEINCIHNKFDLALQILKKDANLYYNWVTSVVDVVAVVDGDSNFIYSGSDINYPGIVNISYPATSIAIAEMLVHESSHQYWFMSQWFEDIVNGNDTRLYYSPIKKCERPLWAIHTAYHAFSNVVLFYDFCVKANIQDDGYSSKNILPLLEQMKVLQKTLELTDGLTGAGECLWKPLADKLNSYPCY